MSLKVVNAPAGSSDSNAKPVTAEDQRKINRFARLHLKSEELKSDLKKKNNDLQNLNDAADELLLLDDADTQKVPLKVGESFVHYDSDSITTKIDDLKQRLEAEIEALKATEAEYQTEMTQLKVDLYGKFGNNINLEIDDD
uniref:Prefoldin subunit 4 n=1 Tax=Plectus sambesii TaxID=2011161 RepID=A0A914VGY6_9BILA